MLGGFSERYCLLWLGFILGCFWSPTLFTDDKGINMTITAIILLVIAGFISYMDEKDREKQNNGREKQ